MKPSALAPLLVALALVPATPSPAQTASAPPDHDATTSVTSSTKPTPRKRAISSEVAAALAASMPKYNPPPKVEPKPEDEEQDLREIDKPRNGIIRLPKYIVQDKKPPVFRERDLHTKNELATLAMTRYSGLGAVPLSGMNRGIALFMYQEDERLQNMAELKDDAQTSQRAGDTAEAQYIKREATRAYMRDSGFGR